MSPIPLSPKERCPSCGEPGHLTLDRDGKPVAGMCLCGGSAWVIRAHEPGSVLRCPCFECRVVRVLEERTR